MATEPRRASEAARRLGLPTVDLLRLVHDRSLPHVMVDGIPHIPVDAVEEYLARSN